MGKNKKMPFNKLKNHLKNISWKLIVYEWLPLVKLIDNKIKFKNHIDLSEIFKKLGESPDINIIKTVHAQAISLNEHEEERHSEVQTSASVFLGGTSILTGLFIGFSDIIFSSMDTLSKTLNIIILVQFAFILLSLIMAMFHSATVFKRMPRSIINEESILNIDKDYSKYVLILSITILNCYRYNSKITNYKIDCLSMAYRHWKRGILLLLLLGLLITALKINGL